MEKKGKFIVFEGLDGCGKTTQMLRLKDKLAENGVICKYEREPSGGDIGALIRGVLTKRLSVRPETLALLFAADRLEHVSNDILPGLAAGVTVLCDRFVFSNLAYQSAYLPMESVRDYNRLALDLLTPDLTIFIDVPPEVCYSRIVSKRANLELFDDVEKWRVTRENFLLSFKLLDAAPVVTISGDTDEDAVFDQIWNAVNPLFVLD